MKSMVGNMNHQDGMNRDYEYEPTGASESITMKRCNEGQ